MLIPSLPACGVFACRSRQLDKALSYMQAAFRLLELLTPSSAAKEKRADMKATMEHTQHSRSHARATAAASQGKQES